MAKKQSENFLDFIPVRNPEITFDVNGDDGIVTLHILHKGFYNKIAQKLFSRPRVSHIELEKFGSFIWQHIDGAITVGEIAQKLKDKFGTEAEPLYPRLTQYMATLHKNRFVLYKGKDKGAK